MPEELATLHGAGGSFARAAAKRRRLARVDRRSPARRRQPGGSSHKATSMPASSVGSSAQRLHLGLRRGRAGASPVSTCSSAGSSLPCLVACGRPAPDFPERAEHRHRCRGRRSPPRCPAAARSAPPAARPAAAGGSPIASARCAMKKCRQPAACSAAATSRRAGAVGVRLDHAGSRPPAMPVAQQAPVGDDRAEVDVQPRKRGGNVSQRRARHVAGRGPRSG